MLTVVKAYFHDAALPYSPSLSPHTPLPPGFPPADPLTGVGRGGWVATPKDIPDFNGCHGDGRHGLTEAATVHHHHEQIAARDLLDDKGPAGTRGRRDGEPLERSSTGKLCPRGDCGTAKAASFPEALH